MTNASRAPLPPYPRLGEVYRILANAFDTKNSNRTLDRLAQEGDFNWQKIPEIHEKVFLDPLSGKGSTEYATFVVATIEVMRDDYLNLIKGIPLDALTRAEALPALIRDHFAPRAAQFLLNLAKDRRAPRLPVLLNSEKNPIDVVFSWLERSLELEDQALGSKLFPGSTGEDKDWKTDLRRWRQGLHLPTLAKIFRISEHLKENYSERLTLVVVFTEWLITARALAYIEQQTPLADDLRGTLLKEVLTDPSSPKDIGEILSHLNIDAGNRLQPLKEPGLYLLRDLHTKSPKERGDLKRTEEALKKFEQLLAQHDEDGVATYLLWWLTARWHVLAGKHADALDYYEKAVDDSLYRSGETQRSILEEALYLAASQRKLPLYKRLKHRAIVLGLAEPPNAKKIADQEEMTSTAADFDIVFPECGSFVEAQEGSGLTCLISSHHQLVEDGSL